MLSKKSLQKGCGIEMRNNRISQVEFLNQCCASQTDFESILLGGSRKIFFRQYRPKANVALTNSRYRVAQHVAVPKQKGSTHFIGVISNKSSAFIERDAVLAA
jgi:hypothetical protein